MKNRKYDYVLIDLDGTLTNSEEGIYNSLKKGFKHIGLHFDRADIRKMIGPPIRVSMKKYYNEDGERVEELLRVYRANYAEQGWRQCVVYDGIFELLQSLKKAGVTMAVATSKPLRFSKKIIHDFGLADYFAYIGAAVDDGSRDSKSAVVEDVIENLQIKDRDKVVLVGDTIYDVIGAREAGIDCVSILWGFGLKDELESAGAKVILPTPKSVEEYLLS